MKNAEKGILPYQDAQLPTEDRVSDLVGRMTIKEKVRQLDQYFGTPLLDKSHPRMQTVMADDAQIQWDRVLETIGDEGIGCIHDLYAYPAINNALQHYAVEQTRLGIPLLFSEEALHGLGRPGCTVFPHAITQAGTWDPAVVEQIGRGIAA